MKKFLKIIGILTCVVLVLLITLPFLLKGKVTEIVKTEANKMLNAKLDFETLDISLIRNFPKATISLYGLSVVGIDHFEGDTLVAAKKIAIAVDVMSLFSDSGYEITYALLDRPVINALIHEGGTVNWDIIKTTGSDSEEEVATEEAEEESVFKLQLKKFRIKDASITYIDDAGKMAFCTEDMDLTLSGDMSGMQTALKCETQLSKIYFSMDNVDYLNNAELEADMKLLADLDNYKFTLDENRLRLNAIEMVLDGWVAMPGEDIDMDIKLNTPKINFKDILSMIPAIYQNNFADLQTSGNVSLQASAKGKLAGESLPSFTVALDVNSAKVFYTGMPKSVDDINIALRITNTGGSIDNTIIDIAPFKFSFVGNPFALTLHAATPMSDLQFGATANGTIDLGAIKEIYPLGDSISLNGIVTTALSFKGKMSDIEKESYQNIEGNGSLGITDMKLDMTGLPPIVLSKASAEITPKYLSLDKFDITVGNSDLHANGKISNYLPYVLNDETLTGTLTLTSSMLNLDELMGETTESDTAKEEENSTEEESAPLTVFVVPENLNLSLQTKIEKILFQNMTLSDFKGKVTVNNGTARLNSISVEALGGNISANGLYSTAQSTTSPVINFSADIKKASFEETFKQLDMIQQLVPLFAKTGGSYSVSLDMDCRLDNEMSPMLETISAKGRLKSNDIQIQNIEAFDILASLLKNDKLRNIETKDIDIAFTIENGRVKTAPFTLKIGNIGITLSGSTGLDQTIDYIAAIDLSKEKVVSEYVGIINATIGGTFTSPKIGIDTKSIVKEAVTNKIVEAIAGEGTTEEQIASIRSKAEDAGRKLVEIAEKEGNKLVEKAENPLGKIAAKAAKAKLVDEAKKQAAKLADEAEAQIRKMKGL